ncbi:glycoside hydrolase family 15 protein [Palleronia sp. LCG004]|uniref:glycoside hydrolase family 15 protein n=1 Tax=Palleronia sp. LCG004 TaxID=3079304 RepID=UPI0029421A71|nr:glycoside hydrolase family 15 protein [Palleronia sp. LCG004]WOI55818.1 glycoside hydrolase family 15 protein [Palleronia sp. LCG004]
MRANDQPERRRSSTDISADQRPADAAPDSRGREGGKSVDKRRISDYAMIGDCQTAAMISRDGSIDWLSVPRFDAPSVFAALLGEAENGRCRIAPKGDFEVTRRYRPGTLILETEFRTETGTAVLTDFMPIRDERPVNVVRILECRSGTVELELDLRIRFDYGAIVPWVTHHDATTRLAIGGPDALAIRTPLEVEGEGLHSVASIPLEEGDRTHLVLTYYPSHLPPPEAIDPLQALTETERYWRDYTARCPDVDGDTEAVANSLVILKALTYAPTGGVVAAATTSLPEEIGGSRNWDYRYCWLRDATMTLVAFMDLGYFDEARAWRDWLMRAIAGDPARLQIMYSVTGERRLQEWQPDWLGGFRGSSPVRIGNAASGQLQLDVFGEVFDMLAQASTGIEPSDHGRDLRTHLLERLEKIWREPDAGIWEPRGGPRHHVHSKVMAWVAFDRAAKGFAGDDHDGDAAARWRAVADEIHAEVLEHGFDTELDTFVQSYDSTSLDASLLFIPLVGFLPADDPRVVSTVAAIERSLMVGDTYLRRYDTKTSDDGLEGSEGMFLACSFWLADVYVLQGRRDDARAILDRLIALRNDVGLLPEEIDAETGEFLGNLPQAFSHVGLITTALNLSQANGPAKRRSHCPPADE